MGVCALLGTESDAARAWVVGRIAVVKLHFNGNYSIEGNVTAGSEDPFDFHGESDVPPRPRPSAGIGESRLCQYENAWNKNRGLGGYRRSSSGLSPMKVDWCS